MAAHYLELSDDMVERAGQYAAYHHHGQLRRTLDDSAIPFIAHPANVVNLLMQHGVSDPATLAIAWLHDTVEDTKVTHADIGRLFGPEIAHGVCILTREVGMGVDEYKQRIAQADNGVKLVKFCDMLDNLRTVECMRPSGLLRKMEDARSFYIPMAQEINPQIAARMKTSIDDYFARTRPSG
ncbi:HD domain-containing protein [Candidatus Woesearchaeota archaeon]|nr:HD domain-containing protein [Candidatus Woesearchaeota archaeon]